MFSKLKEAKILLAVLLILTWVIGGALGFLYYQSNVKTLKGKDSSILQLSNSVNQIGNMVTAYTVTADVKTGKKIEDTDVTPFKVPITMATNLVLDKSEMVGKYFKLGLTKGTAVPKDAVWDSEITDDMRLFDVVLNNIPVGIKEGSYVDVRISLPLGEDFIAIPHKKVYAINGGIMKLAINESDILSYNSMLVDSLLYPGTNLYAIEYLEGGLQKAADAYYPVSKNVLAIAQKDPNLLDAIKSDMLQRRDVLETGLSKINTSGTNRDSLDVILQRGRAALQDKFVAAERDNQLKEEKAAQQAKENSGGTGTYTGTPGNVPVPTKKK